MSKPIFKLSMVSLLIISILLVLIAWKYGGVQVALLAFTGGIILHGALMHLFTRTKIKSAKDSGIPFPLYPEPGDEFIHNGARYSYTGSWYKKNGEVLECVDDFASEIVSHCDNCRFNRLGLDGELGPECDDCGTELKNFKA